MKKDVKDTSNTVVVGNSNDIGRMTLSAYSENHERSSVLCCMSLGNACVIEKEWTCNACALARFLFACLFCKFNLKLLSELFRAMPGRFMEAIVY